MNKNFHRVIFNARRGQRMVVQETATSTGKGRNGASAGAGEGQRPWVLRGVVAALALIGWLPVVHAQIVPNPLALPSQRPQTLVAPNGVPLVNITTPSAGGVISVRGGNVIVQAAQDTTTVISALASQAAVSLINNQFDLSQTLKDLGSSSSVHSLVTAILTGGALAGLNMNPTGMATAGSGAQGFATQLGQNLQAGAIKALIGTAVNGGSLEDNLKQNLITAFIDTAAAQGANAIGDLTQAGTLDSFGNKVAHAIAGCIGGIAKADNASGCGAGALGAALGELAAEAYGRKADTVQFASMISALGVALAGGDAQQISIGQQAGANAAANNYVSHSPYANVRTLVAKENARLIAQCEPSCTIQNYRDIDLQIQRFESAANLIEASQRSELSGKQAAELGEILGQILPVMGNVISAYEALTGKTLITEQDLSSAERFFSGLAIILPIGSLGRSAVEAASLDARVLAADLGILREASLGRIASARNFSLGEATFEQANRLGEAWVGAGFTVASDGRTLVSADGLRQYRPPAIKDSPYATTGIQANFQGRVVPSGPWTSNGHLNISKK